MKRLLVLLLLLLAVPAGAQSLADAPLPLTVRTLDNGLTVAVVENHAVPIVTVEAAVRNGAMNEPPRWNGLSHLWEHMFFKGNARIPDQDAYLRRARELGMIWNGTTGTERVNYFFTLPSANLRGGLQFMSDALRSPRFDPAEFEREKQVVLGEFDRNEATPGFHLWRAAGRALWGDLYSRKDALGDREAVKAATREDMMEMQRLYYVPENTLLVVAGDVTPAGAFPLVDRIFGDWRRSGATPSVDDLRFPPLACSRSLLVEQPVDNVTVMLQWIGPGVADDPEATFAADVFSFIVDQPGSRLQKALVDGGLAESAGLSYYTQRRSGEITLSLVTDRERAVPALRAALAEVSRFADPSYFTPEQLANARTLLSVQDLYGREVAEDLAHDLSFWWSVADMDYYRSYIPRIQSLPASEVTAYARHYLVGRPLVLAVMAAPGSGLTSEALDGELSRAGLEVCR